jgi:hypothetical protein
MPLTSTQERPCEVHRDRCVWRLRCADVVDDGRGLARHDRAAPGCEPFRLVALRLASGEFAIGEQSCVGGDHRSAKLKYQSAIEIEISQADACLMLQEIMREGDIRAQGPIKSANADLIEKEFWRFALPDANGYP